MSEDEPPDMDDTQRSIAGDVVEVFGEQVAKHIMSAKWANKADGLADVAEGMADAVEKRGMKRVVVALRCVMEQAMRSKVKKVIERGLLVLGKVCDALEGAEDEGTSDALVALSPILHLAVPVILARTSEVNSASVEEALSLVSRLFAIDRAHVAPAVFAPVPPSTNFKFGQGRLTAVERLIADHGLSAGVEGGGGGGGGGRGKGKGRGRGKKDAASSSSSVTIGEVLGAVLPALKHAKAEVRGKAITLVAKCHVVDSAQTERMWKLTEADHAALLKSIRQAIAKEKGEKVSPKKKVRKKLGASTADDDDDMTEEDKAEVARLKKQLKMVKDAQKQVEAAAAAKGGGGKKGGDDDDDDDADGGGDAGDEVAPVRRGVAKAGNKKRGRGKKSVRIANPPVS